MGAIAWVPGQLKALAAHAAVAIALAATACSASAQVEVSTATLPRFDAPDTATHASRVDIMLMPQHASGVGVSFGIANPIGANPLLAPWAPNLASMDLGLHWRVTLDSHYRFDVTAYRRVPNADAMSLIESRDPSYGARMEVGLGSFQGRSKGFVADKGFLGLQLESGARVSVKRSHGGPMLYYRNKF